MGQKARSTVCLAMVVALSGCMEDMALQMPEFQMPSFLSPSEEPEVARSDASFAQPEGEAQSEIITDLMLRQSVLESGSAYDTVAQATLNASSRAAEAELRSAKLRAEAQSKNWLPTLGPNISLTSMGDLVASILIEQVLFDNGRKKAERAFAAADVEVAAVNLSVDMNDRVYTALSLYLAGLKAEQKAGVSARAVTRMQELERVVVGRVRGGVSDMSDQRVVEGKLNDMRAALATERDAAATSRAELQAMTGQQFDRVPDTLALGLIPQGGEALSVLKAQAEAKRSVAQAEAARAGLLPGLTASANVAEGGTTGAIGLDMDQPLGFGTGAQMRAIEASKEIGKRQVGEAQESARRTQSRQAKRLSSYQRQEKETAGLVRENRETFALLERQYEAGHRPVLEVISFYETLVAREQELIDTRYEVIAIQLELARDRGTLADGDAI